MKKTRRISTLFLILAIILSILLMVPVSAADDASITINKPANLSIEGQTFAAFKIFDVTTHGDGTKKSYAYTVAEEFEDFTDYPNSTEQSLVEYIEGLDDDSDEMNEIVAKLWKFINDNGIFATKTMTAGSDVDSVVIDNLPYGYYLVFGTGITESGASVVAACSLTTAAPNVSITLKVDAPTINKEVYNPDSGSWGSWSDVNIGETVDFILRSTVPVMTGYSRYHYIVHDTMSPGLAFDPDTLIIKINNIPLIPKSVNPGDYDYELVTSNIGDCTFMIIFNPIKFAMRTPGEAIEIFYSATLEHNAVPGFPGNDNMAILHYNHNPYTDGIGVTPETIVKVYTFPIDIYKYTGNYSDAMGTPLEGAEFELRTVANDPGTAISVKAKTIDDAGNFYVVAAPGEGGSITKVCSSKSGKININGLDTGIYYLVETKAPDGFNLLADPLEVEIIHTDGEGNYTLVVDGSVTDTINIQNNAGNELPSTGGIGTALFYVGGILLVAIAVVIIIVRRKREILKGE